MFTMTQAVTVTKKDIQGHAMEPKDEDEDWKPSTWRKHVMKKKDVTLQLPAKKLPSILVSTSTTIKTSIRQGLKITVTLLNAGGGDINEVSQSISTIYRQRKASVKEKAAIIRNKIQKLSDEFLVVHWDGKTIQLMPGQVQDRLAICISVPNQLSGQFFGNT